MTLFDRISESPLPASAEAAARGFDEWDDRLATADPGFRSRAAAVRNDPSSHRLLAGVFGSSPHLTAAILRECPFVVALFEDGPEAAVAAAFDELDADAAASTGRPEIAAALRRAKRRVALTVALADLAGAWPLELVTSTLSELASRTLDHALAFLLRDRARSGRFALPAEADGDWRAFGIVLLGMGKLGAGELNFSSDVDLIALYDSERVPTTRPERLQQDVVHLIRDLVTLMEERTAEGYVFRTDLRLRPDPASTPLAVSIRAAEVYYESVGQNWERAAMLKARPVAGDIAVGDEFLETIRPFVWRRHLDFWAIKDIHSIKRQINANRGGGRIATDGHNVKLGRGGIREVEFYAQTLQLIWGGREPSLRVRPTIEALSALVAAGHVEAEVARDLTEAYGFLRRVEHRLQMVDDHQTHSLPDAGRMDAFVRFMGYDDMDRFRSDLHAVLRTVETHYGALFEEDQALGSSGNLVFTGADDDPETLATLRRLGYEQPERVAAAVRDWHRGRMGATRSTRARELLTELMPRLLEALGATADPDDAFRNFDAFLHRLPAGVQLFALFQANPDLLGLVAEIMGSAPHLAAHLSRHPIVLDAVLTGDFNDPPPDTEGMRRDLAAALERARDFQDVLDATRRWTNDRKFQVGVQVLHRSLEPLDACRAYTDIADSVVAALLPEVERGFAERHGRVPDSGIAILAYGKWGSVELTPASDLDMVVVYDAPDVQTPSAGAAPLSAATWYLRLTQRLLTAVTTLTGEGRLYEVDLRLRPSGSDGPIAAHIAALETYQHESAWPWEHMALTRARVVAGPPALTERIEGLRRAVLTLRRDPALVRRQVSAMRRRMAETHAGTDLFAVKHRRGGLVDLDFIAQCLTLAHAADHPALTARDSRAVLTAAAEAGLIAPDAAHALIDASRLWIRLQLLLRLMGAENSAPRAARPAIRAALAAGFGDPDFATLEARIEATYATVAALFDEIVGDPAAAAMDEIPAAPLPRGAQREEEE